MPFFKIKKEKKKRCVQGSAESRVIPCPIRTSGAVRVLRDRSTPDRAHRTPHVNSHASASAVWCGRR